jgi:hypothetical protein
MQWKFDVKKGEIMNDKVCEQHWLDLCDRCMRIIFSAVLKGKTDFWNLPENLRIDKDVFDAGLRAAGGESESVTPILREFFTLTAADIVKNKEKFGTDMCAEAWIVQITRFENLKYGFECFEEIWQLAAGIRRCTARENALRELSLAQEKMDSAFTVISSLVKSDK